MIQDISSTGYSKVKEGSLLSGHPLKNLIGRDCMHAYLTMDYGSTILIFLAFIQASCGQSLTGPPATEQGSDTVYTCTGGTSPYVYIWEDVGTDINIFVAGEAVYNSTLTPKYVNFDVSENGGTSTMTISNTLIEDEGQYRCTEGSGKDETVLTVEVKGTWSLSVESTIENNIDMYKATCEALNGRPDVTITWMLGDGPSPCNDPVGMDLTAGSGLFNKTSVCTFQATSENNKGQTLKCVISGHLVSELNGEVTITLPIHSAPRNDSLIVTFQFPGTSLRVSCDIVGTDQPDPLPRNYSIFSDGTQIPQSSTGINFVVVPESEFNLDTEFYCQAWNYLGIATSQTTKPTRTTAPPPTTAPEGTTSGDTVGSGGTGTDPAGLSAGALAGIAIGVIACIVIIVVVILYLVKPECCPCFATAGSKSSGSSKKPAGSAVGSSNGSEKDKINKPEAAPRGQGSIQHTANNPGQELYALPERKQPAGGRGGDAPDRGSGPGQNEPQGMLYADLDLSSKAGHTEKHVPKNENDVVVYSSILV